MQVVMVRYGELFLKSEPVKRRFINQLIRNISRALDACAIPHALETHRGRILIHGDDPDRIAGVVSRIFGVVDVSVATLTTHDMADLASAALDHARRCLSPEKSFAIRARRQGVTGFTSQELGAAVGSAVLDHLPELSVDLDDPDCEIFVEARDFGGLVYSARIPAPGGLPWGTQGRVLALVSGGLDSPVASWLMMRRGCEVSHLYLDGGCWTGKDRLGVVTEHHRLLSTWCRGYPIRLMVVPIETFYHRLADEIEPRYRCVLCKRFMLRIGSRIAEQGEFSALVTGDNLGQVASQTLVNMALISSAATVPILRPADLL
jgi:tRNA uracil 4-sulfurtransferase